jgi:hypothetical protein
VTVRESCRRILESGNLEAKLAPPVGSSGEALPDEPTGPPLCIDRPVRDPELEMHGGVESLPRPGELASPEARARCLARFANHELMAVEFLAWASLRWPDLPTELRRGFVAVLAEEQLHCRLYLGRLRALGSTLRRGGEASRGPQRGIHRVRARRPLFTGAISRTLVEAQ